MPTPIQSSSITSKLRSFFRLRGRQIFTLDETAVPVVQVETLTGAPYRAGHQVRFMAGAVFDPLIVLGRNFIVTVLTSPLGIAPISLANVAGVAVIEKVTIQDDLLAPLSSSRWDVNLTSHGGLLGSLDFPFVVALNCANVDSANNPVGTSIVQGEVPIKLVGGPEGLAPALGTQLRIGEIDALDFAVGTTDVLAGAQVVIGDNVALTLRNKATATAGFIRVNVVGSYYPLARS